MSVLSNTTVLSNFASISATEVLRELYGEVYISVEVHREIQDGLEEGYSFYLDVVKRVFPPARGGWIKMTSLTADEVEMFSSMPAALHQGEASSLAIARNRGWLLLTDDKAARKQAAALGIRFSGSLGCLVQAVERGLWSVTRANECLSKLIAAGFYSPIDDLTGLLSQRAD